MILSEVKKIITRNRLNGHISYIGRGRKYKCFDDRTKEIEGVFYVYPIEETSSQVLVCCPNCGEIHRHGKVRGHRISHCKTNYITYFIA